MGKHCKENKNWIFEARLSSSDCGQTKLLKSTKNLKAKNAHNKTEKSQSSSHQII
jgi:hypothetical protein